MGVVHDYRHNLIAQKRWSKMDTGEAVVARVNGLPITAADMMGHSPCELAWFSDDGPSRVHVAPDKDPA